MIDWADILKKLGSTALILGAAAYVAKKLIETWLAHRLDTHKTDLDHALERHKSDLNHVSETALENLRYELRVAEAQQSRLRARQANIIAGVFARLERFHQALQVLAAPIRHEDGGPGPLAKAAINSHNEFVHYYHERAIWLDVGTTEQVNAVLALMRRVLQEMDFNLQNEAIADRSKWIETYGRLQTEIPQARAALDRQFRTLLGVVTPTALTEHASRMPSVHGR